MCAPPLIHEQGVFQTLLFFLGLFRAHVGPGGTSMYPATQPHVLRTSAHTPLQISIQYSYIQHIAHNGTPLRTSPVQSLRKRAFASLLILMRLPSLIHINPHGSFIKKSRGCRIAHAMPPAIHAADAVPRHHTAICHTK